MKADDSVYSGFENIVFEPHSENNILDFTSLNYSSPSSVKYQYKLDEEWIDIPNDYINFFFIRKRRLQSGNPGKELTHPGEIQICFFTVLPF
ncbi:MAG: hypothetical protein IPG09_15810 [Ignavibacteria bacterium]|nr:hypothetical protein [Ignavibacteria bacterium]